jgi:hypothetical protein
MSAFLVESPAWIKVRLTKHVSRRFPATPGHAYDAAGEGVGNMATFLVEFVDSRNDETVEADHYVDVQPFVDFLASDAEGQWINVARYRADDIRRILRRAG